MDDTPDNRVPVCITDTYFLVDPRVADHIANQNTKIHRLEDQLTHARTFTGRMRAEREHCGEEIKRLRRQQLINTGDLRGCLRRIEALEKKPERSAERLAELSGRLIEEIAREENE